MAIYMNFSELKVKGNVTAEGYKDWIRLDSFSFGVDRDISMEAGHMSNREATRPNLAQLTLSKLMDTASLSLFKESLTGNEGVKVQIDIVRTSANKLEKYVSYELEDVMVGCYSVSSDINRAPSENLSLSFSKIVMAYTAADRSNNGSTPERIGYDLHSGKSL